MFETGIEECCDPMTLYLRRHISLCSEFLNLVVEYLLVLRR